MTNPSDDRRSAPATLRNRDAILAVLQRSLPESGTVLEIASGTGEHVVHFAKTLPALEWQPSDPNPGARSSITAWINAESVANVRSPLALDVHERPWPVTDISAILCINMVHISPWSATEALMEEAGRLLPSEGLLYLYGPYLQSSVETAASNIAFDADLRHRNPAWGLRDLETVKAVAAASSLSLSDIIAMPANNLSVIFKRR